jgi:hypothetical protein
VQLLFRKYINLIFFTVHGKRALFTIFPAKTTTKTTTTTTTSSGAAVTIPTLPGLPNFSTSGVAGVPFVLPEFSPCPQVGVSNVHTPKRDRE